MQVCVLLPYDGNIGLLFLSHKELDDDIRYSLTTTHTGEAWVVSVTEEPVITSTVTALHDAVQMGFSV